MDDRSRSSSKPPAADINALLGFAALDNDNKSISKAASNDNKSLMSSILLPPTLAALPLSTVPLVLPTNTNDDDDNEDEDDFDELGTQMTKPRYLSFNMADDDVSALDGAGGASVIAGLQQHSQSRQYNNGGRGERSRMGTMTNQRRTQKRKGWGGIINEEDDNNKYNSNDRDASTFQSRGVTTILEEIGLRERITTGDNNSREEENKGHGNNSRRWFNNNSTKANNNSKTTTRGRRRRYDDEFDGSLIGYIRGLLLYFKTLRTKQWLILIISVTFITIQLTTFQRSKGKDTLDHLNWRANNHRQRQRRGDVGLSDVMRNVAMQNVQGGSGSVMNVNRYDPHWSSGSVNNRGNVWFNSNGDGDNNNDDGEGGSYKDTENNSMINNNNNNNNNNIGLAYGSSNTLRDSVPLVRREWEQDEVLLDDVIIDGGDANNNGGGESSNYLRGGNSMDMNKAMKDMEGIDTIQEQARMEHDALRQRIMKQQQQGEEDSRVGSNNNHVQQQQQLSSSSMSDAVAETDNNNNISSSSSSSNKMLSTDKLNEIDPRPIQKLTNDIIPARYANVFADIRSPYIVGRDTPYFWHVPRSGGVVVKTMLSHCLGQTLAAEVGESGGHESDVELKVVTYSDHNYTNVNIATPEGIRHAVNMGLVPSHLADTLISAHVDLIPSLFNANDKGRAFVLLRHPVDRSASMFYFLKDSGYPPLRNMSVDEYAKSEYIENNWLGELVCFDENKCICNFGSFSSSSLIFLSF